MILDDDNEDDGEEFLIEEAPKDPLVSLEAGEEAAVEAGGQEHGALVQQILETQKELQDGNKRDKKAVEIVSLEKSNILNFMITSHLLRRERRGLVTQIELGTENQHSERFALIGISIV